MKERLRLSSKHIENSIVCAISAWCFTAWLVSLNTTNASASTAFAATVSMTAFALCFLAAFALSFVLSCRWAVAPWFLLFSLLLYGANSLYQAGNAFFYLLILAVFALAIVYVMQKEHPALDGFGTMSRGTMLTLIIGVGVIVFLYLITLTLCRYFSYSSPCFDFGIFAQMFHNMRETLQPLTTCERDGLLSHFAVHVSPIYYLYLPFYALIPSPATLLVMQAVFLFSGVIPLLLIARRYQLSRPMMVMAAALYFAYPAMLGGCFYDLHENKLLLPLLLWLFYFLERQNYPLTYLFAVLVLLVKEDAPIYVAFVALYWICAKPRKRHGVALFVLSVVYFIAAVGYLERYGDGAMFGRYENLIGYNGTPLDLIRTALVNPAMVLRECLNAEKLAFLAYMLLPLGLIPLLTRHYSRLILLLPMVLINLMPDYYYQHDIGYQYTYGVAAMLFYLLVLNLPALRGKLRKGLLLFALCATILLAAMRAPNQLFYLNRAVTYAEDSARITECLKIIPDDASVRASTMFVAHLSQRSELYEIDSRHDADYVVLDLRPYVNAGVDGYDIEYFERNGYQLSLYEDNLLAIFVAEE